ncbi:MAG: DsbE family thiol:disulfide interchange protein, partial [Pseudomonadota bacterium]
SERTHVYMIGLNWKDQKDDALAFLDKLGNPYDQIGFDGDGRAGIEFGVYGVPETYLIDDQGFVRYKRVGPITASVMRDEIMPAIQQITHQSF